ncbi:hypothetical protein [Halorientalis salina]|uniref:hypothetical protein n=1 Tax=Halorientalis salina TaxID=2932266 RepID=UPI0010ADA454|nr:hypothetical protein [Halorientalis salina]
MDLTRSIVTSRAAEYREEEPLYSVEHEALDVFPAMFSEGRFGWRDAEWVVRWYYRRFLGEFPHDERQAVEDRFGDNDFETVRSVIDATVAADDPTAKVERLTDLEGVDVPVASAFLMFIDPESFVVVGEREWTVLFRADELERPFPDPPSGSEYVTYLDTCRQLADRFDCDLWTLYMALWRSWTVEYAEATR